MSSNAYSVGDVVVLKADLTRLKAAPRICRIVGVLPSDYGDAQYQVHFSHESFERRISGAEIETTFADPAADAKAGSAGKTKPWLKPIAIGPRK